MHLPDPQTGDIECPHCHNVSPPQAWLPIEPYWDGRELRELFNMSTNRWNGHWKGVFPKYYQYRHAKGSVRPQLVRVMPASQVRAFVDSNVWLRPPKNRKVK